MKAALVLLALVAGPVLADGAIVNTTVKATDWVLKRPGTPDVVLAHYPTSDACTKAVTTAGELVCDQRIRITAVGACTKEAPPFPVKVGADGFVEVPGIVVAEQSDGSWGPTMEQGYLPDVKPYPDCWVLGLVPWSGKWDAPDPEAETSSTQEPVRQSDEFQAQWRSKEACETRHDTCLVYPKGSDGEACGAPPARCLNAENFYQ